MGEIHIKVGRDVRGDVSATTNETNVTETNWDPAVLLRVLNQYQAALTENGFMSGDTGASIEAALTELRSELDTQDEIADKSRVKQLLNRVREFSLGTAASLFAGIVMAQVPWVWTSS